jgi:glycosyltransferase involved in cell wall biosynthesis
LASAAAAGSIAANRAFKTWYRHVRLFLALNEFTRGQYIRGGFPAHKIRVKPNFVADPGPRERPPSASRTVLFVGRLSREKGLEVLLDAWRTVGDEQFELVVVGDGPLRVELERASPRNVRFMGQVPPSEVEQLMLRSRALVFPSIAYEAQPMVVLHALASGLPVLASKLGGNPVLLAPAGERWLAAPGDPSAWTHAVRELLDDAEVDGAGVRLRQLYEDRFSEQIGCRLLEDAYLAARGQVA